MSVSLSKRTPWLDNAKMVAMLCVIAGHTAGLFVNGLPGRVLGIIVAFNMPLFVLLSGYTSLGGMLRLDSIKSLLYYAEKILWRMMIPAVCLSAIDQMWRGSFFSRKLWMVYAVLAIILWLIGKWIERECVPFSKLVLDFARGVLVIFLLYYSLSLNMYWFMSMLLKLQMLVAIMVLLGKCVNLPVASLVLALSALLWGASYLIFDSWTFEMSAYFAIGLVMKQFGIFDWILHMKHLVAIVSFAVGCILCRLFTIDYGFYDNSLRGLISQGLYHIYPLRIIIGLILSFAIIRWVYALSNDYNWFSKMGSYTLAFYTIHAFILDNFLKPYIYFDNPANYMWIFGILATIALTAVTYIIIRVCERWIVTRRLVLGILSV